MSNTNLRLVAASSARPPVHDADAEQALIGLVLDRSVHVSDVSDLVTPEQFWIQGNRMLWAGIVACADAGSPVDPVSVLEHTRTLFGDAAMGSGLRMLTAADLIAGYVSDAPLADLARGRRFAHRVRSAWLRRRLSWLTSSVAERCSGPEGTIDAILEDTQREFTAILSDACSEGDVVSAKDGVRALAREITAGAAATIPSGMAGLDHVGGLRRKRVYILGARTNVGKTAAAIHIARHALDAGHPVLYVSMEVSVSGILARLICSGARVDSRAFWENTMSQSEYHRYHDAALTLATQPLEVNRYDRGLTLMEIWRDALDFKRRHTRGGVVPGLVVIDHLHLVRYGDTARPRHELMRDAMALCRRIASELDCPVLALAQMNRDAAKRSGADPIPKLHELAESSAIEQDADMVLVIHRPRTKEGPFETGAPALFVVAKNRVTNRDGMFEMAFDPRFGRFDEIRQEDVR